MQQDVNHMRDGFEARAWVEHKTAAFGEWRSEITVTSKKIGRAEDKISIDSRGLTI